MDNNNLFKHTGLKIGYVPNKMITKNSGSPILIIVASVDVRQNRLYVDVKGYSYGGTTWTLDFFTINGHIEQLNGPWDKLDKYLNNTRFIGYGNNVYRIQITLVNSGYCTEYVYDFVSRYLRGVYVCKDINHLQSGKTYEYFNKTTLDKIGLKRAFFINTGKIKDRINTSLGTCLDFRDNYFGRKNHAFDTYVYNLAALEIFAEHYCKEILGLNSLNWHAFWEDLKRCSFAEKDTVNE